MDRTVSSETLDRVADELDRTRLTVEDLSRLLSAFVRVCPPTDLHAVLTDVQAVDALDQQLDALAGFIRDLSAGRTACAAAAAVPLATLGARLGGGRTGAAHAPGAIAGDLELFD